MNDTDTKKKKRNKKNKNNTVEVPEIEPVPSTSEKQTFDYKEYIKSDLLNSTTQLKLKPLIGALAKAAQLKDDQTNSAQLFELYRTIHNQKIQSQVELIHTKFELIPLEKDKQNAKEKHDVVLKKAQDKDKFQQMLVDKGNKLNQDKINLIKAANEHRNNLIKEAEEYTQDLQKQQEDSLPEREKLIEENNRLRKEIENCLKESMKMKEEFDLKIRENEAKFEMFNSNNKGGLDKMMEGLTSSAQKNVMENSTLKTEIMTYEQKTEELKKIIDMADNEFLKLRNEIDKKKDESILLGSENAEIRNRLRKNKVNKEEIIQLLGEYENGKNKLNMMESLFKKYNEQYKKLYEEKYPPKKEPEACCQHGNNNLIEGEGNEHQHEQHSCNHEHDHDHPHEHQHEHSHDHPHEHQHDHPHEHQHEHQQEDQKDQPQDQQLQVQQQQQENQQQQVLQLSHNQYEISNVNKIEISKNTQNTTESKEEIPKESSDKNPDTTTQTNDNSKPIIEEKQNDEQPQEKLKEETEPKNE